MENGVNIEHLQIQLTENNLEVQTQYNNANAEVQGSAASQDQLKEMSSTVEKELQFLTLSENAPGHENVEDQSQSTTEKQESTGTEDLKGQVQSEGKPARIMYCVRCNSECNIPEGETLRCHNCKFLFLFKTRRHYEVFEEYFCK